MTKTFRLQPVLKYRKLIEDQHRQKLAETLRNQQSAQDALEAQRSKAQHLNRDFEDRQQQGINAQELQLYIAQIDHQQRKQQMIETRVESLRQETNDRRQDLQHASRQRQLLDNLKQKKLREIQLEFERTDALLMDELAIKTGREGA
jgi:flagellar FliJ protein